MKEMRDHVCRTPRYNWETCAPERYPRRVVFTCTMSDIDTFRSKKGRNVERKHKKTHSNITLQDAEKDISYMLALGFKNVVICSARLIALLEAFGMSRLLASLKYKRLSLQFCQPPRCWIKVNLAAVAKMSTSTRRLSRRTLIFWLIEVFYAREHS